MGPGVVMYGGRGAVVVGELDGRRTRAHRGDPRAAPTFDADAVLTGNIWGYLWSKLIYGALLFATALTDDPIADVLDARRYRPVLAALGREVAAVAAAEQVRLEPFNGFDPAAFTAGAPADALARSFADMVAFNRRSAKTHSGIWRDLAVRRRRTEIDAQIGPIVEIGKAAWRARRRSRARLIALIHDIEDGRRPQAWATLDALAAAHEAPTREPPHEIRFLRQDRAGHRRRPRPRPRDRAWRSRTSAPRCSRSIWPRSRWRRPRASWASAARRAGSTSTDRAAVQALVAEVEARPRPGLDPGQLRRRRARPGRPAARRDHAGRLAGDRRCNLSGAFWCTQAVAPAMKAQGYGRIVNISSRAGLAISLTGIQAYASAKAGLIGLTRQLGHELGPFGITVNCDRAGLRPLQPDDRAAMGGDGRGGPGAAGREHRAAAPGHARGHRPRACCSSPPTSPAGSPARC